jgi:hypothetical protein
MKVMKAAIRDAEITALVESSIDLPLRDVVDLSVAAMDVVRLDPAALGAPTETADEALTLAPLHLDRLSKRDFGRRGIVVGASVAQAVEYLIEHWLPTGKRRTDRAVQQAQAGRGSRHHLVLELEKALMRRESDEIDELNRRHSWGRRRRLQSRFLWTSEDFARSFEFVTRRSTEFFLPAASSGYGELEAPRHAAVVERVQRVGGHAVPRWDVLVPVGSEGPDVVAHVFANDRWSCCPWVRMDPRVVEAFDLTGRLVSVIEGDMLAAESLAARFVVKVPRLPAASEIESTPGVPRVARSLAGAYMLDARHPVSIPPDVPVVDDPREAWAVLARTTSGVFLPDATPAAAPRSYRRLEGVYVVGCVPAARVP